MLGWGLRVNLSIMWDDASRELLLLSTVPDLSRKTLLRIQVLLSLMIPGAFTDRLTDHGWGLSLRGNPGLQALTGDQRHATWEETSKSSQAGFRLLWSALLRSMRVGGEAPT